MLWKVGAMKFRLGKDIFPKISGWGWMGDKSLGVTHGWYKIFRARRVCNPDSEKVAKSRLKS